MTLKKVWVRPKHGIILAGIPSKGAEVTGALAKEWIEAGLVEEIEDPTQKEPDKPADKPKEA